jgi:ubiquinol-cytochrome c reductase iron-sulfur subunit
VSATAGRGRRGVERAVLVCFVVCMLTSSSLAAVYALGGQPQAEGALLGTALVSLGAGLALFGHGLLPTGPYAEEREPLQSTSAERAAFDEAFEREGLITRRRLLLGAFTGAAGTLLVAFVFPVRSLGPSPGKSLERTPWRRGLRAVTEDGGFVSVADVPIGGLVTVFPEGHVESADGQVVLMRVSKGLVPARGRESWTPQGLIAYSKVCTHAGCPVGLYEVQRQQLLCPCHQSAFDVLRGGEPVFGPAARALPQLPLAIDGQGFVVAQSDFHEPIGPSYWARP